ncbi:hypothetical protein TNCT_221471 [Trichonephila clavata]|uniref:Uncharacterized protein n=1 Tax=Trichonephila clavata TaxID=2740835 RepID=A0A8X6LE46_TRICU|nr:hypothetical protein TNCT_221471 [Trichonephila clavata]
MSIRVLLSTNQRCHINLNITPRRIFVISFVSYRPRRKHPVLFIKNCEWSTDRVLHRKTKCNAFISDSTVTDIERSSRSATSIIDVNVAAIDPIILEDRRLRLLDNENV